jgi:hypothetical protein
MLVMSFEGLVGNWGFSNLVALFVSFGQPAAAEIRPS